MFRPDCQDVHASIPDAALLILLVAWTTIIRSGYNKVQFVPVGCTSLLQWGSELQTSLVCKWSKTVCSLNGPLFKPCLE